MRGYGQSTCCGKEESFSPTDVKGAVPQLQQELGRCFQNLKNGMIEMKKFLNKFITLFSLGAMSMFMTACETAESHTIFHKPSEDFRSEEIKSIPKDSPFTVEDIYFAIEGKEAEHDKHYIWLGAYTSSKNREIDILKSSLIFGETNIENKFNEKISLSTKTDTENIYQNSLDSFKLFTIDPATTKQFLNETGERKLILSVLVDGKEFSITFELDVRTDTYTVFPT
ncbi:hypothetical protein GN278_17355 [Rhodobacteraceae bacterium Araon29]